MIRSIEENIKKSFVRALAEYGTREVSAGRDLVFGDQTSNYEFILNIDLPALTASSPGAVENYKDYLGKKLGRLYFTPERASESDMRVQRRPRAGLADIYVDLKTFALDRERLERGKQIQQCEDTEPVLLQQAIGEHPVAVVLGKPGSGKSTFFRRLLLSFIEGEALPQTSGKTRDYAPVFLELRRMARWYENLDTSPEAKAGAVWDYIEYQLEGDAREGAYRWLREQAEEGRLFIVLDGLDEVPVEHTAFIKQVIQDFIGKHCVETKHVNRVLITCRYLSWVEPEWRLERNPALPLYMIRDWDEDQITDFVGKWYRTAVRCWGVEEKERQRLTEDLLNALRHTRLHEIKEIPLLLTIMAMIHTEEEALPHRITRLYATAVDKLIARWDTVSESERGHRLLRMLSDGGINREQLKASLARTAWQVHRINQPKEGEQDQGQLAEIPETTLRNALCNLRPQKRGIHDWVHEVMEGIRLRAGLLLPVGGREESFQFPHRSFQEYMAGLHLASLSEHEIIVSDSPGSFSTVGSELAGQGGSYWRYVLRFAVGSLNYSDLDHRITVRNLLGKLLGEDKPITDEHWRRIWLAGELLLERGRTQVEHDAPGLPGKMHTALKRLLDKGALTWRERAEVADLLNHEELGDDRAGVQMPDWAAIEQGPFIMGSAPDDAEAYKSEHQQTRELYMPHSYCIARYPVTVAQYTPFIEAGGYGNLDWWNTGASQRWLSETAKKAPSNWENQQRFPNRPVLYVTWYEARAWCAWATSRLSEWRQGCPSEALAVLMAKGECVVRLPTEAEWECAARGAQGRHRDCAPPVTQKRRALSYRRLRHGGKAAVGETAETRIAGQARPSSGG